MLEYFICSDEAYFYLHGGHNVRNDKIWAMFQPDLLLEQPLNDHKVVVWSALAAKKLYGPYFFTETLSGITIFIFSNIIFGRNPNVSKTSNNLLSTKWPSATQKERGPDMAKTQIRDRFIKSAQWPPRSPDLNPCDFSLWGTLKQKVYNPRPANIEELKKNIKREFEIFKKN